MHQEGDLGAYIPALPEICTRGFGRASYTHPLHYPKRAAMLWGLGLQAAKRWWNVVGARCGGVTTPPRKPGQRGSTVEAAGAQAWCKIARF